MTTPRLELADLSDAILAIQGGEDLDSVLRLIVERATELVGARYGAIGVPDESGTHLAKFLAVGLSDDECPGHPPTGQGVLGAVLKEGQTLRLGDLTTHPRSVGFPEGHPVMHSFLGVPIKKGNLVLGDLYLAEKIDHAEFTQADEDTVQALARHAALAIANARLVAQVRESEERYRLLTTHAPAVVFALDREGRLTFVSDRIVDVAGLAPEDLLLRTLPELAADGDYAVGLHLAAARRGPGAVTFTMALSGSAGRTLQLEVSLVAAPLGDGSLYGLAQDVTDRMALTRQVSQRTRELDQTRQESRRLREFVGLVIQAQEDERARIAGDLHDTTVQTLIAIGRRLSSLAEARELAAYQAELGELAGAALTEADEVRRLSRNLRPSVLDHLGLEAALRHQAGELEAHGGPEVALNLEGDLDTIGPRQRTALFRIAQEALTNIRRHSGATKASVRVKLVAERVRMIIEDNGRGFDPAVVSARPHAGGPGLGLAGMHERAAMLGGSLAVASSRDGGTRLRVELPAT